LLNSQPPVVCQFNGRPAWQADRRDDCRCSLGMGLIGGLPLPSSWQAGGVPLHGGSTSPGRFRLPVIAQEFPSAREGRCLRKPASDEPSTRWRCGRCLGASRSEPPETGQWRVEVASQAARLRPFDDPRAGLESCPHPVQATEVEHHPARERHRTAVIAGALPRRVNGNTRRLQPWPRASTLEGGWLWTPAGPNRPISKRVQHAVSSRKKQFAARGAASSGPSCTSLALGCRVAPGLAEFRLSIAANWAAVAACQARSRAGPSGKGFKGRLTDTGGEKRGRSPE